MRRLVNRLTLFPLIGLLVIAPSQEAFGRAIDLPRQSPQKPRDAGTESGDKDDVRALEPGKPHRRELAGGQRHSYRIRMDAGQFLKVIIEQEGIDVEAQLSGPDGKKIMAFDSDSRLRGQEQVSQVAEAEGDYRLDVQPKQKAAAGVYGIRIEELRAATINDRDLQEARNAYKKAVNLFGAGKYDEALILFERALEIREKALRPDHPDVVESINGLAILRASKGEYSKAEPLFQHVLAVREKSLGPEDLSVANSLNNLANLYCYKGAYSKAEPLFQRALAIREKSLGPDHL